jgi:Fe2+ transport system protein FeoA
LTSASDRLRSLSQLTPGERGVVVRIDADVKDRFDRLVALGVTPGVSITVLQVFPGIVFLCDQTELVVERGVAAAIQIRITSDGGGV